MNRKTFREECALALRHCLDFFTSQSRARWQWMQSTKVVNTTPNHPCTSLGFKKYNTVEYIRFIRETGLTNEILRKSLKEKHNLQDFLKPQPCLTKNSKNNLKKNPGENFLHIKEKVFDLNVLLFQNNWDVIDSIDGGKQNRLIVR